MNKLSITIINLKTKIEVQRMQNIEIFKSIPMASHEDPRNEKAEPILAAWREGSNKLKNMLDELAKLESKENAPSLESKTFINGFGEATKRNITCSSYKNSENRIKKSILSFIS